MLDSPMNFGINKIYVILYYKNINKGQKKIFRNQKKNQSQRQLIKIKFVKRKNNVKNEGKKYNDNQDKNQKDLKKKFYKDGYLIK